MLNTEARIFWEDIPYGLCILKVRGRLRLGFGADAARVDTGDRQDDRMAPKIYAKGIYQGWSAQPCFDKGNGCAIEIWT